jgi:hypothetical protein
MLGAGRSWAVSAVVLLGTRSPLVSRAVLLVELV